MSVEGNKSFEQQLHNKDLAWGYHLGLVRLPEGNSSASENGASPERKRVERFSLLTVFYG